MDMFLQQVVNGVMSGSVYALTAVGFALVFGVLKVLNLAHPEIIMIGAFVGLAAIGAFRGNFFLALLAAIVAGAIMGAIVQQLAVRPTLKGGAHGPLLATIGASIFLQNGVAAITPPIPQYFPSLMRGEALILGPLNLPAAQLTGFGVTIALLGILTFYVWRTKVGKAIRATSENVEIAECLGVNTQTTMLIAFAISSALGGATGVMIGAIYGFTHAFMGVRFGLMALIAMLVGGMGSITGAVVAGIGLGIIETLAIFVGLGTWRDGILYAVLIVVLIIKPAGLFGRVTHAE